MKKRTLVALGTALFLCSILLGTKLSAPKAPANVVQQAATCLSSIQIGDGIELEFEYGPQLQVISKSHQQQPMVHMAVQNETLTITNLAKEGLTPVQLKVITPGLINLERLHANPNNLVAETAKKFTLAVL